MHLAAQVPPQLPLHVAYQVGHPGHVHCVGQVHCSPNTVPFCFSVTVVSNESTVRSSRFSVSLLRIASSEGVGCGRPCVREPAPEWQTRTGPPVIQRRAGSSGAEPPARDALRAALGHAASSLQAGVGASQL